MALILLIEDEQVLRDNLKELLEMHGYTCITASLGLEGVTLTKNNNPDLVLCDITLPDFDGYRVKIELNKLNYNPPLIFLTARTDKEDYAKAKEVGAVDFITKPFRIKELINRISWILNKKS